MLLHAISIALGPVITWWLLRKRKKKKKKKKENDTTGRRTEPRATLIAKLARLSQITKNIEKFRVVSRLPVRFTVALFLSSCSLFREYGRVRARVEA